MNDKSIEETKAELEGAGYVFTFVDGRIWVQTPDDWNIEALGTQGHYAELLIEIVPKAYKHLQDRKELETLRAENKELRTFVLESGHDWLDVYDPNIGEYVSAEADKLIDKYNITTEEGDTDE